MNIELTDLVLSTITVESKISNINFKETQLIDKIIYKIVNYHDLKPNNIKLELSNHSLITDDFDLDPDISKLKNDEVDLKTIDMMLKMHKAYLKIDKLKLEKDNVKFTGSVLESINKYIIDSNYKSKLTVDDLDGINETINKDENIIICENDLIFLNEFMKINYFRSYKIDQSYDRDILKIGCNYGECLSDLYLELTKPVKKSNRGRKKKIKKISNRKVQGNGKYFNSQLTFTIMDNESIDRFYHLKLFTNGTIQIPFVCNEDIDSIKYIIEKVINIIKEFDDVKKNINNDIEIEYIKSIMRNYKFNIVDTTLFIDLNKFRKVILNFKSYIENNNSIDIDNEFYIPEINTNLYDEHFEELNALTLTLVKHSSERYVGFLLKFMTPIESNTKKQSTVKIFSSCKFNLDGCNTKEQAYIIKKILFRLMLISKDYIFYRKL